MKKTGYIIYQSLEEQRNRKFVEMFQSAGKQYEFDFISQTIENMQSLSLPDFVLNRTRDYRVSTYYERQHIPVFHRTKLVRMANDKAETLRVLRENWKGTGTLRIPKSLVLSPEDSRQEAVFRKKLMAWQEENAMAEKPLVVKTVDGHGGLEVFLLENTMEKGGCQTISETGNLSCKTKEKRDRYTVLEGKKLLCQEMINCDSRDIRVYVLGGEIYSAVLRQGKEDFRSNYSLGGEVKEYFLSVEEYRIVQEYIDCLGGKDLAMAGIDFLVDRDGNLVFNEVEEMVGSRMLYNCTDKDIVQDYVAWLAHTLR